ncbi:MAG: transporter substrate-binding domain-containing protein [Bacteroidota bacterium]
MKHNFLYLLLIALMYSCTPSDTKKDEKVNIDSSLTSILKTRELKAIVNFNATDYYIDRGTPMGFQLEMLNSYCTFMNLKLKIIVKNNNRDEYKSLINNEADILVGDINPTGLRRMFFNFTSPHSKSPLVLIQRKDSIDKFKNKVPNIKKVFELNQSSIIVPNHSSYYEYGKEFATKNNIHLNLAFDLENSTENLIEKVALGEINYTICEQKVAIANANLFRNIDYHIAISDTLHQCWLLPKTSDSLLQSINLWLEKFIKTNEYKAIYSRYYSTTYANQILQNKKNYIKNRSISRWDKYIKKAARKNRWDWKLYAALIYQESGFVPNLTGGGGCFGLLQLMPETGRIYGVTPSSSPETQIMRGANYLKYLEKQFSKKVKDKEQLSKFVVASYNSGLGHVIDAILLTEKYGKDPTTWDKNVEVYLRLKSNPKYFNDPIVKSGYYRGSFTTRFVDDVWARYEHYKNFVR